MSKAQTQIPTVDWKKYTEVGLLMKNYRANKFRPLEEKQKLTSQVLEILWGMDLPKLFIMANNSKSAGIAPITCKIFLELKEYYEAKERFRFIFQMIPALQEMILKGWKYKKREKTKNATGNPDQQKQIPEDSQSQVISAIMLQNSEIILAHFPQILDGFQNETFIHQFFNEIFLFLQDLGSIFPVLIDPNFAASLGKTQPIQIQIFQESQKILPNEIRIPQVPIFKPSQCLAYIYIFLIFFRNVSDPRRENIMELKRILFSHVKQILDFVFLFFKLGTSPIKKECLKILNNVLSEPGILEKEVDLESIFNFLHDVISANPEILSYSSGNTPNRNASLNFSLPDFRTAKIDNLLAKTLILIQKNYSHHSSEFSRIWEGFFPSGNDYYMGMANQNQNNQARILVFNGNIEHSKSSAFKSALLHMFVLVVEFSLSELWKLSAPFWAIPSKKAFLEAFPNCSKLLLPTFFQSDEEFRDENASESLLASVSPPKNTSFSVNPFIFQISSFFNWFSLFQNNPNSPDLQYPEPENNSIFKDRIRIDLIRGIKLFLKIFYVLGRTLRLLEKTFHLGGPSNSCVCSEDEFEKMRLRHNTKGKTVFYDPTKLIFPKNIPQDIFLSARHFYTITAPPCYEQIRKELASSRELQSLVFDSSNLDIPKSCFFLHIFDSKFFLSCAENVFNYLTQRFLQKWFDAKEKTISLTKKEFYELESILEYFEGSRNDAYSILLPSDPLFQLFEHCCCTNWTLALESNYSSAWKIEEGSYQSQGEDIDYFDNISPVLLGFMKNFPQVSQPFEEKIEQLIEIFANILQKDTTFRFFPENITISAPKVESESNSSEIKNMCNSLRKKIVNILTTSFPLQFEFELKQIENEKKYSAENQISKANDTPKRRRRSGRLSASSQAFHCVVPKISPKFQITFEKLENVIAYCINHHVDSEIRCLCLRGFAIACSRFLFLGQPLPISNKYLDKNCLDLMQVFKSEKNAMEVEIEENKNKENPMIQFNNVFERYGLSKFVSGTQEMQEAADFFMKELLMTCYHTPYSLELMNNCFRECRPQNFLQCRALFSKIINSEFQTQGDHLDEGKSIPESKVMQYLLDGLETLISLPNSQPKKPSPVDSSPSSASSSSIQSKIQKDGIAFVEDGILIDQREAGGIFDPFFQSNNVQKTNPYGQFKFRQTGRLFFSFFKAKFSFKHWLDTISCVPDTHRNSMLSLIIKLISLKDLRKYGEALFKPYMKFFDNNNNSSMNNLMQIETEKMQFLRILFLSGHKWEILYSAKNLPPKIEVEPVFTIFMKFLEKGSNFDLNSEALKLINFTFWEEEAKRTSPEKDKEDPEQREQRKKEEAKVRRLFDLLIEILLYLASISQCAFEKNHTSFFNHLFFSSSFKEVERIILSANARKNLTQSKPPISYHVTSNSEIPLYYQYVFFFGSHWNESRLKFDESFYKPFVNLFGTLLFAFLDEATKLPHDFLFFLTRIPDIFATAYGKFKSTYPQPNGYVSTTEVFALGNLPTYFSDVKYQQRLAIVEKLLYWDKTVKAMMSNQKSKESFTPTNRSQLIEILFEQTSENEFFSQNFMETFVVSQKYNDNSFWESRNWDYSKFGPEIDATGTKLVYALTGTEKPTNFQYLIDVQNKHKYLSVLDNLEARQLEVILDKILYLWDPSVEQRLKSFSVKVEEVAKLKKSLIMMGLSGHLDVALSVMSHVNELLLKFFQDEMERKSSQKNMNQQHDFWYLPIGEEPSITTLNRVMFAKLECMYIFCLSCLSMIYISQWMPFTEQMDPIMSKLFDLLAFLQVDPFLVASSNFSPTAPSNSQQQKITAAAALSKKVEENDIEEDNDEEVQIIENGVPVSQPKEKEKSVRDQISKAQELETYQIWLKWNQIPSRILENYFISKQKPLKYENSGPISLLCSVILSFLPLPQNVVEKTAIPRNFLVYSFDQVLTHFTSEPTLVRDVIKKIVNIVSNCKINDLFTILMIFIETSFKDSKRKTKRPVEYLSEKNEDFQEKFHTNTKKANVVFEDEFKEDFVVIRKGARPSSAFKKLEYLCALLVDLPFHKNMRLKTLRILYSVVNSSISEIQEALLSSDPHEYEIGVLSSLESELLKIASKSSEEESIAASKCMGAIGALEPSFLRDNFVHQMQKEFRDPIKFYWKVLTDLCMPLFKTDEIDKKQRADFTILGISNCLLKMLEMKHTGKSNLSGDQTFQLTGKGPKKSIEEVIRHFQTYRSGTYFEKPKHFPTIEQCKIISECSSLTYDIKKSSQPKPFPIYDKKTFTRYKFWLNDIYHNLSENGKNGGAEGMLFHTLNPLRLDAEAPEWLLPHLIVFSISKDKSDAKLIIQDLNSILETLMVFSQMDKEKLSNQQNLLYNYSQDAKQFVRLIANLLIIYYKWFHKRQLFLFKATIARKNAQQKEPSAEEKQRIHDLHVLRKFIAGIDLEKLSKLALIYLNSEDAWYFYEIYLRKRNVEQNVLFCFETDVTLNDFDKKIKEAEVKTFIASMNKGLEYYDDIHCQESAGLARAKTKTVKRYKIDMLQPCDFSHLRKLFVAADSMDELHGLKSNSEKPSLDDIIVLHELNGNWNEALNCYEMQLTSENPNLDNIHPKMLESHLNLGHYNVVMQFVEGAKNDGEKKSILEFGIKAAWRLGKWEQLSNLLKNPALEDNLSNGSPQNIEVLLAQSLLHFHNKDTKSFYLSLQEARNALAKTIDPTNYSKSYKNVVNLQIIHELELSYPIYHSMENSLSPAKENSSLFLSPTVSNDSKLISSLTAALHDIFKKNLELTSNRSRIREPIFSIRRTIFSELQKKQFVGENWLDWGIVTRKQKQHQTASAALTRAVSFNLPEARLQQSKLEYDLMNIKSALQNISIGLDEIKKLYKDKKVTDLSNSDRVLISKMKIIENSISEKERSRNEINIRTEYEKASKISIFWEKGHLSYAKYLDRYLSVRMTKGSMFVSNCENDDVSGDSGSSTQKNSENSSKIEAYLKFFFNEYASFAPIIIEEYGKTLQCGCNHLYEALPRMLSFWFEATKECGAILNLEKSQQQILQQQLQQAPKTAKRRGRPTTAATPASTISQSPSREQIGEERKNKVEALVNSLNSIAKNSCEKLPRFQLYTALNQLISNISHSNEKVQEIVRRILVLVFAEFPQIVAWSIYGIVKLNYKTQKKQVKSKSATATTPATPIYVYRDVELKPEVRLLVEEAMSHNQGELKQICMQTDRYFQYLNDLIKSDKRAQVAGAKKYESNQFVDLGRETLYPLELVLPSQNQLDVRMPAKENRIAQHKHPKSANAGVSLLPDNVSGSPKMEIDLTQDDDDSILNANPLVVTLNDNNFYQAIQQNEVQFDNYAKQTLSYFKVQHHPFTENSITIKDMDKQVQVMASAQKPFKIQFIGSDNKPHAFILKGEDDIRQDARHIELCSVINRLLKKDPESRSRNLHIRTFAAIPTSEDSGLIEWVQETKTIKCIMDDKMPMDQTMTGHILGNVRKYIDRLSSSSKTIVKDKLDYFAYVATKVPAGLLSDWLYSSFPYPELWLRNRKNMTRTLAVMSMVGFIVGLGDRHTDNILLDLKNGEIVHIDFGHYFESAKLLIFPERVPFRLTRCFIDAMGPTGYEGPFRIACEHTLRVLRNQKDTLINMLETFPFIFGKKKKAFENLDAKHDPSSASRRRDLKIIKKKLQGRTTTNAVLDLKKKEFSFLDRYSSITDHTEWHQYAALKLEKHDDDGPFSVERQVEELIIQATDPARLCMMFSGWFPWG